MSRERKKPSANGGAAAAMEIKIPDVTDAAYPAGVPKNEDGSVVAEADVPVEQARKIGAVTPESAQYNRDTARKIHRKQQGEADVRWGELDALHVFDNVRMAFSPTNIYLYMARTDPEPFDYRPFPMTAVKNGSEFYDYVLKNIHKESGPAKYTVRFKESNGSERGRGYLRMPDTKGAVGDMSQHQQQPPPFPPIQLPFGPPQYNYGPQPQYGYQQPPPNYGYQQPPPGYYPPQYQQQPQQPQQPQQQQQYQPPPPQQPPPAQAAPVPQAPPPQPAQVAPAPQEPQAPQYAPQPQYAPSVPQPPQRDDALYAATATTYQELKETQNMLRQNQLQIERALGELTEMKRSQISQHQQQQQMQQAQQQQPAPAPQPPMQQPAPQVVVVSPPFGSPQPFGAPQYPYSQQQPFGAPPAQQQPVGFGAHMPVAQEAPPQREWSGNAGGGFQPRQQSSFGAQPPPWEPPYAERSYGQSQQQYGMGAPPQQQQYAPQQPQGWPQPQQSSAPQGWPQQPQQQTQQPQAAPVVQPAAPAAPAAPVDPLQQFQQTTGMIVGMAKAVKEIHEATSRLTGAFNGGGQPQQQFEEDDFDQQLDPNDPRNMPPQAPPDPGIGQPFHTMPLGVTDAAPVWAYNSDGTPNVTGMILGNLPKLPQWFKGVMDSFVDFQKAQQPRQIGMGAPNDIIVESQPQQPQYVQQQPQQPQYVQQPQVQQQPQHAPPQHVQPPQSPYMPSPQYVQQQQQPTQHRAAPQARPPSAPHGSSPQHAVHAPMAVPVPSPGFVPTADAFRHAMGE